MVAPDTLYTIDVFSFVKVTVYPSPPAFTPAIVISAVAITGNVGEPSLISTLYTDLPPAIGRFDEPIPPVVFDNCGGEFNAVPSLKN